MLKSRHNATILGIVLCLHYFLYTFHYTYSDNTYSAFNTFAAAETWQINDNHVVYTHRYSSSCLLSCVCVCVFRCAECVYCVGLLHVFFFFFFNSFASTHIVLNSIHITVKFIVLCVACTCTLYIFVHCTKSTDNSRRCSVHGVCMWSQCWLGHRCRNIAFNKRIKRPRNKKIF